jgi:hypothetical protein
MAANPLSTIIGAARAVAQLPFKLAGKAVGAVTSSPRATDREAPSTRAESQARPEPPAKPEASASPTPGPETVLAEPDATVEEIAEAAVARELAEQPQPTESTPEPSPAPPTDAEPETVYSTSTEDPATQ